MKRANCLSVIVLLSGFAALLPSGAQELYKWVDENGKVQYSDRPPPAGVKSQKKIKTSPHTQSRAATGTDAPEAPSSYAQQEAEFRKRQVEKAEKEAADKQALQAAAAAKQECERARQNLARLQSGAQYVRYNSDGEQEYLDDKARAEEIAHTQKVVAEICK